MTQVISIKGAGDFELPEGRLLRHFDNVGNYAIVEPATAEQSNPFGLVDSISTRAYRNEEDRRNALVALITKNGGQPKLAQA